MLNGVSIKEEHIDTNSTCVSDASASIDLWLSSTCNQYGLTIVDSRSTTVVWGWTNPRG